MSAEPHRGNPEHRRGDGPSHPSSRRLGRCAAFRSSWARPPASPTPFGQRGWWYSAWTDEPGWQRVEIPAAQVPRISARFLDDERLALGDWMFKQEYLCQFVDTVEQLFTTEQVERAFSADVEPPFGLAGRRPMPAQTPQLAQR